MKRSFAHRRMAGLGCVAIVTALGLAACSSSGGASDRSSSRTSGSSAASNSGAASSKAGDLAALLPDDIKRSGTLVAALDQGGASNLEATEGSKVVGFDPDLIKAIGAKLGLKVEVKPASFDALLAGVQAGRFDVAMAGMADTNERQKTVSFVDYVNVGLGLVVKKGNPAGITGADDLCGKKVAMNKGGYPQAVAAPQLSEKCKNDGKSSLDQVVLPDISSSLVAVQSGRADTFYGAAANTAYLLKKTPGQFEVVGGNDVLAHAGIAFDRSKPQLGDAIEAALQALMDSGEYESIAKTWDMTGWILPKATQNVALI